MSCNNEVRFLLLSGEESENLAVAYKVSKEKGLKCVWVSAEVTQEITTLQDEVVYVIEPIQEHEEDSIVNKLVSLKYPVVDPRCILTVLQHGVQLPNNMKYPVISLTMLGTVICFSNILIDEREKLVRLVELMGGKVSRPLHNAITHLVVGEVGSVKYFTAAAYNIKIMKKDWIYHMWNQGKSRFVQAKDGKWEKFLCPVFFGCSLCMTGFSTSDKSKVQNLVKKFGGDYCGAMKLGVTTHLVVNKPEGQKYAMASKFGVKVVNINWVYDSIENGACQNSDNYPVKVDGKAGSIDRLHQSTPENPGRLARMELLTNVSNIDPSTIDETVTLPIGDISASNQCKFTSHLWSFPMSQDYSEILDGMHVYLTGFLTSEEEKMGKLLSLGSAVKCTQLTSSVNRVVVGDLSRVDSATRNKISAACLQSSEVRVVSQSWVLDSLTMGKIQPEKDYCETLNACTELHKFDENHAMGRNFTHDENDATFNDQNTALWYKPNDNTPLTAMDGGSELGLFLSEYQDDKTLLSQYTHQDATEKTLPANEVNMANEKESMLVDNQHLAVTDNDSDKTWNPSEDATGMQQSALEAESKSNYFSGKTFFILGFPTDEFQNLVLEIQSGGGSVLAADSKKVADYMVVPLTGWLVDKTANEVVTIFWLKVCIELGRLMDASENRMCIPFSVPPKALPLKGCVACLSKYRDSERVYLTKLIVELGGIVQEIVARRNINNMLQTTHLIICEPGGDKYVGCKKWQIPIVNEKWVYECAEKGKKLDERQFSVDVPKLMDESSLTGVQRKNAIPQPEQTTAVQNKEFLPMPRPPSVVNKIRKRLIAEADMKKKTGEEAVGKKETPVGIRYKKMRLETPSKFMGNGTVPSGVTFDLTDVYQLLKTPVSEQKKIQEEIRNNPDTPISEFISRCLDKGVASIPDHLALNLERELGKHDNVCDPSSVKINSKDTEKTGHSIPRLFDGLVVCLAKKLHKEYKDLGKTISSNGGEFRWTYDNIITHFIYQGNPHDRNKELLTAKEEGKFIVSPFWVKACVEAGSKVDEKLFPHMYHPDKYIQFNTSPPKARKRSLRTTSPFNVFAQSNLCTSSSIQKNKVFPNSDEGLCKHQAPGSQMKIESLERKLENIIAATHIPKEMTIRRLSCSITNTPPVKTRTNNDVPMTSAKLSQDVQVSWDDPTGREEMERLTNKENVMKISNPEAEETYLTEDSTSENKPASNMCFIMSSVSSLDKTKYEWVIRKLGGEFSDSGVLTPQATHLITPKPGKSEKFLSAVASGRYILQIEYLKASEAAGHFLPEDQYEYGNPLNPFTKVLLENPGSLHNQIALSPFRWRRNLDHGKTDGGVPKGAFAGWRVVLDINERQLKSFERLLQCGSAQVLGNNVQCMQVHQITHVFVDVEQAKKFGASSLESLVTQTEIHVCSPSYIGDYLLHDPPPKPQNYYVPQVMAILERRKH